LGIIWLDLAWLLGFLVAWRQHPSGARLLRYLRLFLDFKLKYSPRASIAMDIFQALEMASSQDPARAQAGLKSIQDVQKRQGAFAEMLAIASNRAAPLDVRRIAIIHFKNTATNQWRSRL